MHIQVLLPAVDDDQMVGQHLDDLGREVERVVGVGEVSRGLRQIEDLRRRLPGGRRTKNEM